MFEKITVNVTNSKICCTHKVVLIIIGSRLLFVALYKVTGQYYHYN